ncbi:MAG: hypothetical protein NTW22_03650 [Proteobacteria bacterium]|nr:hypothetical protein [Pseudomonadota bacterium]
MPLVFTLQEFIEKSLKEIAPEIHTDKVVLEPTKDISHGDLASNAAMVCAKAVGISPRELAVKLIEKITTHDAVVSAEIAGPGFINIKLKPSALQNELKPANQPMGQTH